MRIVSRLVLALTLVTGAVGALAVTMDRSAGPADRTASPARETAPAPLFDARHRIDWRGVYVGRDGRDDALRVVLSDDQRVRLEQAGKAAIMGRFDWYSDGRRILLHLPDEQRVMAVGDGVLHPLDGDSPSSIDDDTVLRKQRQPIGN